ncbi:MAG TPA: SH3 domain-containing protein [Anaerolineales bacterium]|nr:SH3 domain-containing protein [Anaerolineales bacterium]
MPTSRFIPSRRNESSRYNPAVSIRLSSVVLIALTLFSTGCGVEIRNVATPSPIPLTATLPVILTQAPSETPLPPPPQPTVASVEGTTSTQINVRAEPSTSSNVLGIIPANTNLEIIGKDLGGNWWQINYAEGVDGKGWVTAQYVTTGGTLEVPVIGGDTADPDSGNVAVIQQQLNVRSGPGTDFNSLGTLNAQDVVKLTGKDRNGAWLQIDFPTGPEGRGWVNAAFVRASGVENLPIVTEAGQVVGTGTPTVIPSTPTLTVVPAWTDNDSQVAPIVSVIFEPTGTQTFIYNGEVSSPQGDAEDWIAFKPYNSLVFISLECRGSDAIRIDLAENSVPVNTPIRCGDQMKKIILKAGANYAVHLQATPTTTGLQFINYTLTIKMRP